MDRPLRLATLGISLVVAGCTKGHGDAEPGGRVEVGAPAPAYSAKTMTGSAVSLASMRPKIVLMNVWATWCGPCRKEIPELIAINSRYKDRGLQVVGITVDADGTD